MNYIGFSAFDTANGPGVRVSLFCSGCTLKCKGCFNPESWDFAAGNAFTEETMEKILKAMEEPFISGLSLLGGDPLEEENAPVILDIVRRVKEKFGETKTIWLWTGRTYEHVKDNPIFEYVDTVIDGPFVQKLKMPEGNQWFGSSNQRVIPIEHAKKRAGCTVCAAKKTESEEEKSVADLADECLTAGKGE